MTDNSKNKYQKNDQPKIFVISDSIGETAELVAKAAMSQFSAENLEIKKIPYVSSDSEMREIIDWIAAENVASSIIIVYTLVIRGLKEVLCYKAAEYNIRAIDIMTPVMMGLAEIVPQKPANQPGLIRQVDEEYFKRIEAIEFAVKYDDGKDARGISRADVVLIGVSRASKTPLCMYLAHKRIKAANVPLVPEIAPPDEIFGLDAHKVIGLTIKPQQLNEIRRERLKTMGLTSNADYAALDRILKELDYAEKIMKKIGCPVIDVTNKAVEETASKILEIYFKGERHG